jgi:putative phosphoribosyl transferase
VTLGIPRGGVVVAAEIVRRLGGAWDILLVRKVGVPGDPEYGLGAVAEGGVRYLDEPRVHAAGLRVRDLEATIAAEEGELARRRRLYRGERLRAELRGRTAILVDDGVATGGTMLAALEAVRREGPSRVIVALGVCPPSTGSRLREAADDLVVLLMPSAFEAVGQWYRRFEPVEDEEVVRLLGDPALGRG